MKTPSCSYTTYNKMSNEILKTKVLKSLKLFIPYHHHFDLPTELEINTPVLLAILLQECKIRVFHLLKSRNNKKWNLSNLPSKQHTDYYYFVRTAQEDAFST